MGRIVLQKDVPTAQRKEHEDVFRVCRVALCLFKLQVHKMIYRLEREFNYAEHWCCALTADQTMLFAINQNREYFFIDTSNKDKAVQLLSNFVNNKNIFLSWDIKVNLWCREKFNIMPINLLLFTLAKRISYKLACCRAGLERISVADNDKNNCALQAQNILSIYRDHLYEKVFMILSLSKEYKINFINTNPSAVIEKIPNIKVAYKTPQKRFFYKAPDSINFVNPVLQRVFEQITSNEFIVQGNTITHAYLPQKLDLNGVSVKIGFGGMHGFSDSGLYKTGESVEINDYDVTSYYSSLICNEQILNDILGEQFVEEYRRIVTQRIQAKQSNPSLAKGLKEIITSVTGKLNYPQSKIYNPQAYIQLTLTGQLYMLMIADDCVKHGIKVLSINTDGLTVLDDVNATETSESIIRKMEYITGFKFDKTMFSSYCSRNINSYYAVKSNGDIKTKGLCSADRSLDNNNSDIAINKLVSQTLVHGGEPMLYLKTLKPCDFVNIACQSSGETIRFYKATGCSNNALYFTDGTRVPNSERCAIVNDTEPLQTIVPKIDYDYYLDKAQSVLDGICIECKKFISPVW